eukprot:10274272-Alexandrium_andersonii.AAC.1
MCIRDRGVAQDGYGRKRCCARRCRAAGGDEPSTSELAHRLQLNVGRRNEAARRHDAGRRNWRRATAEGSVAAR